MKSNLNGALEPQLATVVENDTISSSFEVRRLGDLVAVRNADGSVTGFHARNLEVAVLDPQVWNAVAGTGAFDPEILQELQYWQTQQDPTVGEHRLSMKVQSLNINISQICNLHCTYCAAGGDGSYGSAVKQINLDTTYQQLSMLLGRLQKGDQFHITFLGGEPLVYPPAIEAIANYVSLFTAGRELHITYGIVTNGTLITEEVAELLARIGCEVTVSIDGPAHINDVARPTRGGLGSTERTLRGIEKLARVKDRLSSLISASVFGMHYSGVVETWNFLRGLPFDQIKFDFAAAENDGEASRAYIKELSSCAEQAFQTGGEAELRRLSIFNTYFKILDGKTRVTDHCGAGKNHLQLDTSGKFSPCQWFVGSPAEHLGQGVKLSDEARKPYQDALVETNKCGSCWARYVCGGGCMFVHKVKTGSKNRVDQEFCYRMRSSLAKGIEFYAKSRQLIAEEEVREIH